MGGSMRNPPLKPDGTLDYARLTVAQVCEDLTETLLDLVENGGRGELVPFLNDCPEPDRLPAGAAPARSLVASMEQLLRFERSDPNLRSSEAREAVATAVRELRASAAA